MKEGIGTGTSDAPIGTASRIADTTTGGTDSNVQLASYESGVTWLDSMKEARALSIKTGKPILADFTGSDWCAYCVKLREEVFDQAEFQMWAADRFVLLELDYPRHHPQSAEVKRQNESLKEQYKIDSYPTVLFLDARGTVIGKSGYVRGGPKAWIKSVEGR